MGFYGTTTVMSRAVYIAFRGWRRATVANTLWCCCGTGCTGTGKAVTILHFRPLSFASAQQTIIRKGAP